MCILPKNSITLTCIISFLLFLSCSEDEPSITSVVEDLAVLPNPATTDITISFDLNKPEKIEIDIITRWGQILHQVKSNGTLEIGRHHYHLDISEDSPGIYFGYVITPSDTVQFHYQKE